MNKSAIKNTAIRARLQLLAAVKSRAREIGIDEKLTEEAAYFWFVRLVALRFSEANGDAAIPSDTKGFLARCNALSGAYPEAFSPVMPQYAQLLPENWQDILERLRTQVDETDWCSGAEILGCFYQYYMSEKHAEVVDPLHGKGIRKEDIPAATQLFTTDWVVQYLLDNSLGRYWLERHPESKLAEKLSYLILPKDGKLQQKDEDIRPEQLRVLDPCVGAGNFLLYAFDLLMEIYRECGWNDVDAARSIAENNLYGLDIDDKVVQLACFAVRMKAAGFGCKLNKPPHILAMQDAGDIEKQSFKAFEHAKECGSLLYAPQVDLSGVPKETKKKLSPLIEQAEILNGKYEIVATNPPYLNRYSENLKAYIEEHFASYKGDLFSAFMVRCFDFCKPGGYLGFMTPNVWMFIRSYEALRRYILENKSVTTLIQMAKGAYFKEATVDVAAFVLKNEKSKEKGLYLRLEDFKGGMELQREKVLAAVNDPDCGYLYETSPENFSSIPGSPIAYWASEEVFHAFAASEKLGELTTARNGMKTGKNDAFVRLWYEVDVHKIKLDAVSAHDAVSSEKKWFPYNKGGEYRKWYGNEDYVVDWEDRGGRIFAHAKEDGRFVQNYPDEMKFSPSVTWSLVTSGAPSFRYKEHAISDIAGMSLYEGGRMTKYYLALCNSKVASALLKMLAPTLNAQAGDIARLPVLWQEDIAHTVSLADENIRICKEDWDSFETSWAFKKHPLI